MPTLHFPHFLHVLFQMAIEIKVAVFFTKKIVTFTILTFTLNIVENNIQVCSRIKYITIMLQLRISVQQLYTMYIQHSHI